MTRPSTHPVNAHSVNQVSVGIRDEHASYNLLRSEQVKENSELRQRFMSKVSKFSDASCWVWSGSKNERGYGTFSIAGKAWLAHRVSYFIFRGEIAKDKQIDHKCVNRWCVNPFHLQQVTDEENKKLAKARRDEAATHCKNGHALVEENLVKHLLKKGTRTCAICFRAKDRMRQGAYRSGEDYKPRIVDKCLKGHDINERNTWMDSLQHDTVACKVCYAEFTNTPLDEVQKIGEL